MKSGLYRIFAILLLMLVPAAAHAQAMDTAADHAILIEAQTDTILFEKDADTPFPPSSMAKMMTAYLLFERVHEGALGLDDTLRVSAEAWRLWFSRRADSPSMMFVKDGEDVRVEDLIRGIVVSSGNDACSVVAEGLAGSEQAFADWMNAKAEALGMTNTHFTNASGWPDPAMYTTTHDMARLAERLIEDFPELYLYFGEKSFTYGLSLEGEPITQANRNPILYTVDGADGLKTGHAQDAGYALTGSATRDGRRLILVASGLDGSRARSRESQRLIEYGFRNFKTYAMFHAGQVVEEANVWLGEEGSVPLVVAEDIALTMSRADRNRMKVTVSYDSPIPAPIEYGTPIATVRVTAPGLGEVIIPLVAGKDVVEEKGLGRLSAAFTYLLFGSSD